MSPVAAAAARLLGIAVIGERALSGGSLSTVVALDLIDGRCAVAKPGGTARAEAAMLTAIDASGAPAPDIFAVDDDLLIIERLDNDGRLIKTWVDLACILAKLHKVHGDHYGWHRDHRFGIVIVPNGSHDNWPDFWAEHRVACHLPYLDVLIARRIEKLAADLHNRLPAHPTRALLHGDLWGGNIMVAHGRVSGLIDPACYYGDREVDAAMLTLFDNPPPHFFDALAFEPGWRDRQPIYRLWPLLVHLRLFGPSYTNQVTETLSSIGV